MNEVADVRANIERALASAAAGALVHDYSLRYIAASPQRMEQLLAAYRCGQEPWVGEDEGADDQS